jgi:hypothetical protein
MGEAFDSACKELHDTERPAIVYEVIAKRIIDGAKNGERDPVRLRNAALAARETNVASILPFIRKAGTVFDDRITKVMGEAFDSACNELHDTGQPAIVYEVIAKRIIDGAKNGERDPVRLRNAALAALGFGSDDKQAG